MLPAEVLERARTWTNVGKWMSSFIRWALFIQQMAAFSWCIIILKNLILIVFVSKSFMLFARMSFAFVYHAQTDGALHTRSKRRKIVFNVLRVQLSTCFKAENAITYKNMSTNFLYGDNLKLKAVAFITWKQHFTL